MDDATQQLYDRYIRYGNGQDLEVALDNDPDAAGAEGRRAIAGFHVLRRWENKWVSPFALTDELANKLNFMPAELAIRLGLTFAREIERRSKFTMPYRLMLECDQYIGRQKEVVTRGNWLRSRLVWSRDDRSFNVSAWYQNLVWDVPARSAPRLTLTHWSDAMVSSPARGIFAPLARVSASLWLKR